jgi:RNA polymerase sigma-70 factor (ECF subfamily)
LAGAGKDDPVAALIARIGAGDRAALRALYAASAAKLHGVVLRMLGDRGEAAEALQDVYVRVWAQAARFDPARGQGMAWLIAIARNCAIDRLRARPDQPASGAVAAPADPARDAEAQAAERQARAWLAACLGGLPPERAAALRGAYLSGLGYRALAEYHAVSPGTMRAWLRRGLIALRECLER